MEKVSFKKILSEKANFAIHCETAAEAKSLFRRLQKEGFRWRDGEELDEYDTYWSNFENETVYTLNVELKEIQYIWIGNSLFSKEATPFKQICFCDCESCKFDTPSV